MTENEKKPPTVRQLLQAKKLPARATPFLRATSRLFDRLFRRPVGNSARIWARLEMEDPFERREKRGPKAAYRGVYAKGRFVRFDKMEREEKKKKAPEDSHAALVARLKKQKAMQESAPKKAAPPKPPPKPPAKPVAAPPKAPKMVAKKEDEPLNRRPPMPKDMGPKRRPSGRVSTRTQPNRRGRMVAGATPPPVALPPVALPPGKARRQESGPTPIKSKSGLSIEDRRPVFAGVERTVPPAAQPPPQDPNEEAPKAPAPKASAPVNRSPTAASGGSGGMNDLFSMGGGEGRLRLSKKKKPKPEDEST
jgi:hypothetical protein